MANEARLDGVHRRTVADSRVMGLDFTDGGDFPDFAENPITGATITQDPPDALTIGSPDVATTPNVVAFRVSGGVAGQSVRVSVTATNGTDTKRDSIKVISQN